MEFLDSFVLPQSDHHMVLLQYLLILTYILLIPYMGVLIGATYLSLNYNKKGKQSGNKFYFKLAKDIIDLATINKSVAFALGIVPMLSAAFCYAQLLSSSEISLTGYILVSFLFLIAGVISIYSYKYSFHLKDIFNSVKEESNEISGELNQYKNVSQSLFNSAGNWALYLILFAAYVFFGATTLAIDPSRWESASSIFSIIFSFSTLMKFLFFVSIALVTTTVVGLFYLNEELKETANEYKEFVKDNLLKTGLAAGVAAPILYVLVFLLSPEISLADTAFGAAFFALMSLLIVVSLTYLMLKEEGAKYINSAITFLVLFFIGFVVKEQSAFNAATVGPFYAAAKNYELHIEEMKTELGLGIIPISGEDIFNGRCAACHKFDQRLVGPSYNSVLPKYADNRDGLVQFILNPVKVDPNYPPMPNQGLKPAEAEAITDYIINIYNENGGAAATSGDQTQIPGTDASEVVSIGKTVFVNGQDFFEKECLVCHRMDSEFVGPAYNDVLPKYVENVDSLVEWIYDPQRVNHELPIMPNQGLTREQAKEVAVHLLKTYKENY